jgi:hypothetical protein
MWMQFWHRLDDPGKALPTLDLIGLYLKEF